MNVLTTSLLSQSLKVTVRSAITSSDLIVLRNETTKDVSVIAIDSFSDSGYYYTINALFELNEGTFYSFKIQNVDNVTNLQDEAYNDILTEFNDVIELEDNSLTIGVKHYGMIFCTDQTDYSINKNEYNTRQSNNDFITI